MCGLRRRRGRGNGWLRLWLGCYGLWCRAQSGRLGEGSKAVAEKSDIALQALDFAAQLLSCVLGVAPDHKYCDCDDNDEKECHESD